MMTSIGRNCGKWRGRCGQGRDDVKVSATRPATPLERRDRPSLWRFAGWALAICFGLISGGRSPAAEILILQGAAPQLMFDDNVGTIRTWNVFGDDSGFDITTGGNLTGALHIDPGAASGSLFLGANGHIGFGTSSPQANLHVSTIDIQPTLRLESTVGMSARVWDLRGGGGGFDLLDVTNSNAVPFGVGVGSPTNTMHLASSGNVGIGTATPDANSRLDIRSSLTNGLLAKRASAGAHFLRVENSTSAFRCGVQGNGDSQLGTLTAGKGLNLLAGGTGKVAINAAGQICFGNVPPAFTTDALKHQTGARLTAAGVWTDASSRTVKQDIEPITSEQARDTVRALQPVGYRYKNELDERYVGFIAEDVPELVATSDRKSLAPMDIVAVLTKVVQDQDRERSEDRRMIGEQQKVIAQQQKLLETLNQRLVVLEQKNQSPAKPVTVPSEDR